jgi:hypothetical protein
MRFRSERWPLRKFCSTGPACPGASSIPLPGKHNAALAEYDRSAVVHRVPKFIEPETDAPARRRTTSRPTLASTLLRGVLEGSEQLGQPSAAIQATQLSAKPVGLLVDRKESGAPGDFAAVAVQRPRWRSVSSFAR